jgi:hypothetical protein
LRMTLLGMTRPRKVRITQLARSVALRASEVKTIHSQIAIYFLPPTNPPSALVTALTSTCSPLNAALI